MKLLFLLVAGALAVPAAQAAEATVQLHDNPFHVAINPSIFPEAGSWAIRVENRGSIPHDFTLCASEAQGGCSTPLAFTPLLKTGQNLTLTVELQTGSYAYICRVAGHAEGGMKGTLTVGPGSASTPTLPLAAIVALLAGAAWRLRR
ncbi:MAG: plastocyanin/azurin family copper-binding protein [Candidatus Thermoplasmatota archaeon]